MSLRPVIILEFLYLFVLCGFSQGQVFAQSVPVTQVRSFPYFNSLSPFNTEIREIPLYDFSIVNLNQAEGKLEVFDLEGNARFTIDYGLGLNLSPTTLPEFEFVGKPGLLDSTIVEVVFALNDSDQNEITRRISEDNDVIYQQEIPSFVFPDYPYFYEDPLTKEGFVAHQIFNESDSVLVYSYSGATRIGLGGAFEYENLRSFYSGIPLIITQGDSLAIGYDVFAQEVSRMEPRFGANQLTILVNDISNDGVLDAYSTIDTVINGNLATRAIWYDNNGTTFLDTFLVGQVDEFNESRYTTALLPDSAQYTLNYSWITSSDTFNVTFSVETGALIESQIYPFYFPNTVCFEGEEYLVNSFESRLRSDTLYNWQTGAIERSLPSAVSYEGEVAKLSNVVGLCDPNLPERVALVYDQPTQQRILFTDADTTVQAELSYQQFAFAFRLDGNVYALADLDENGAPASTVYRIGEQISNSKEVTDDLEISVAPNPARSYFQVLMTEHVAEGSPVQVEIYTLSGQEVARHENVQNSQALATPALPGVYIVQIVQSATGRRITEKLVVR